MLECRAPEDLLGTNVLTTCVIDYNNRKSSVGIVTDAAAEKQQRRLLVRAAEREREANRLKTSFLSNMSHEIRTPMNAIIGLTEVQLRKNPNPEALSVYKKINSSAKNLLQIINDILDLSKIEADKIELFPAVFDIREVLDSAALVSQQHLDEKPVELTLDLSPDLPRYMVGDKTRLWQILRNLLDNAIKFTHHGSVAVTVSEDTGKTEPGIVFVSFSVADTGIGMTREQADKVFMPYEQLRGEDSVRRSGTGLGLPIASRLCRLMGGTISVDSQPGHGTVMRFTLPFGRTADTQTEPGGVSNADLPDFGGDTAADLVLMDLHMPVLDGYEAAKILRSNRKYDKPPIISLTADAMTETYNECLAIGFNDIITKPATFEDLHKILLKWLPEDKRAR